ncbi:MAG: helix-turn-helix domain-containing protein [Pseudomonadota bacterium]
MTLRPHSRAPLRSDEIQRIDGGVRVELDPPPPTLGRGRVESHLLSDDVRLMRADLSGQKGYKGEITGVPGLVIEVRLDGVSQSKEVCGAERQGALSAGNAEIAGCAVPAKWLVTAPDQTVFRTVELAFTQSKLARLAEVDKSLSAHALSLLSKGALTSFIAPAALRVVAERLLYLDLAAAGAKLRAYGIALEFLAISLEAIDVSANVSSSGTLADRIAASIRSDPHPARTLCKLAEEFAVSEATLKRAFVAKFGVSPGRFARQARLDFARDLLSSGKSVSSVASILGYASGETMSRAFAARFGHAPSQLLRNLSDRS